MMKQQEIQYFWPLTEQIPLDLDYTGCEAPKLVLPQNSSGQILYCPNGVTWTTTTITPSLSINPTNAVGEFTLGSLNIGMERKPNLLRRTIYKLLGFNWKDK